MNPVLIDSDILIEISRARNRQVLARWVELSHSDAGILCSPVTVAEIWSGARPTEQTATEELLAALVCVPIGVEIGRLAGHYMARYAKSHNLEIGDALIAATASSHSALLWTRNRKHYPMRDVKFY